MYVSAFEKVYTKKGIEEGQKNVARNMLSKGLPVEQVAEYTMLALEEVEKLLAIPNARPASGLN
jgi:predicted transposase YdaD